MKKFIVWLTRIAIIISLTGGTMTSFFVGLILIQDDNPDHYVRNPHFFESSSHVGNALLAPPRWFFKPYYGEKYQNDFDRSRKFGEILIHERFGWPNMIVGFVAFILLIILGITLWYVVEAIEEKDVTMSYILLNVYIFYWATITIFTICQIISGTPLVSGT